MRFLRCITKKLKKIVCHSREVTVVDSPYQVMQGNRKSGQHFNGSYAATIWRETHFFAFAMKLEVKGKNNVGWLIGTSVSFTCKELLYSHFK